MVGEADARFHRHRALVRLSANQCVGRSRQRVTTGWCGVRGAYWRIHRGAIANQNLRDWSPAHGSVLPGLLNSITFLLCGFGFSSRLCVKFISAYELFLAKAQSQTESQRKTG